MIVDDSPTEQHVMSQALENHGYRTVIANDGEEAISKAQEVRPEVILMDVVMPGMNGFQATRKLSKNPTTASIPVVMVSTKNKEVDRVWAMRQGAVEYLVKPVDPVKLLQAVEAAMNP